MSVLRLLLRAMWFVVLVCVSLLIAYSCSNDETGPQPPECAVAPTTLDFGTVPLGDSLDRVFIITNDGGDTLKGRVTESSAEYSVVSGAEYSLDQGQPDTVAVRFKPTSKGLKECRIETGSYCAPVSCSGTGDFWQKAFEGRGRFPSVSPTDASLIAFASNRTGAGDDADFARWHIWVADLDGGIFEITSGDSFDDLVPVWSPDGTHIAFERHVGDETSIYTVDVTNLEAPGIPQEFISSAYVPSSNGSPGWVVVGGNTWMVFCNSTMGGNDFDICAKRYPESDSVVWISADPADFAREENNVLSAVFRDVNVCGNGTDLIAFVSPDRCKVCDIRVVASSAENPDSSAEASIYVNGKDSGRRTPHTFLYRPAVWQVEVCGWLAGYSRVCSEFTPLPDITNIVHLMFAATQSTRKAIATSYMGQAFSGERTRRGARGLGPSADGCFTYRVAPRLVSTRRPTGISAGGLWLIDLGDDPAVNDDKMYLARAEDLILSRPCISPDSKYVAYIVGIGTSAVIAVSQISGLLNGDESVESVTIPLPGSPGRSDCVRVPGSVSWFPGLERRIVASVSICGGGDSGDFEIWIGDLSDLLQ